MISIFDYMTWYYRADVKFEMIKSLFNREFALLSPAWIGDRKTNTRTLRCHSVQHLDWIYNYLHIFKLEKYYNFYYSLARYKYGIPYRDYNVENNNIKEWFKNHHKEMAAFDLLIDIDATSHKDIDFAYESAKAVKKFFDKDNVSYELRFSGMGFHFIIPYGVLSSKSMLIRDEDNIYDDYKKIAVFLNKNISELIDLKIFDSRRLCKLPYSLSLYEDETYVCLPFKDNDDFNSFKLERFKLSNVLPMDIRGKGLPLFNDGKKKN